MSNEIHIIEGEAWATMPGMVTLGAKLPAIKQYRARNVGDWQDINGKPFMRLGSIPKGKVKQGMLKESQVVARYQNEHAENAIYDALNYAQLYEYNKYRSDYEQYEGITPLQATQAARQHAVFQCLLDRKKNGSRDLKNEYAAYNRLYPGKYGGTIQFSKAIGDARTKGIFSVALDKRCFGNNKRENKKNTPHEDYVMARLVSSPKVLSASELMIIANPYFESQGMRTYELTWYKGQLREWKKNIEVYKSRYGAQEASKLMPFITAKHADYSNVQFQIDGVVMPFWGKHGEGDKKGFKRYNVVLVIDSHSKKIVGWSFGAKENTTTIMEAVRDAVNKTGVLPFEMVSDNHSFNKTKQAENLQSLFVKKGARWTVTHNPQYKAIVERYNQYLNSLWKMQVGYLGKGIRSKTLGAITKPELLQKYAKNFLSEETIKAYAIQAIDKYNDTRLKKTGKSPNEQYASNLHPNPIALSLEDKAELLTLQTEKKVSNNQITFISEGVKIEFVLSSKWFSTYNNETVIVRYDALQDGIWIFDRKTDMSIDFLYPKKSISSAKIEQNEEDEENFMKNAGLKKGITTQARKELENLTSVMEDIDPELIHRINMLATGKDIVEQLQENADMKYSSYDKELRVNQVNIPVCVEDETTPALQPKTSNKEEVYIPKNHSIGMVNPLNQFGKY